MRSEKIFSLLTALLLMLVSVQLALAQDDGTDITEEVAIEEVSATLGTDDLAALEETVEEAELEADAQAEVEEDPGTISGLGYQFKRFGEGLSLALAFNEQAKAKKELEFANRRVLEARKAALAGNEEAVARARQAHEELLERAQERLEGDDAQSVLEARERLREHLALVRAANNGLPGAAIDEAGLEARIDAKLEQAKARLEASGEFTDEELEEKLELLKAEIDARVDERTTIDERLTHLADNIDEKIKEGRERIANAEEMDADVKAEAEASLSSAADLTEAARTDIGNEDYDEAARKLLEARKLAMAPIIRSRLNAAAEAHIGIMRERLEAREEIREQLEEKREQIRADVQELRADAKVDAAALREKLRERLDARAETMAEHREEMRAIMGDDGLETRERLRIENEDGRLEQELRVRQKDGVLEQRVRIKASAEEEEESEDEQEDDKSGSSDDDIGSKEDAEST